MKPLAFALFFLATLSMSAQDEATKIKNLKYQVITRDLIHKALTVDDPELKSLLALQAASFIETFELEEELSGEAYGLLYNALKESRQQTFYKQNGDLTLQQAMAKADSGYNQYHGHKPDSKNDRNVAVRSVFVSNDGEWLYSAGGDGRILKWNIEQRTSKEILRDKTINRIVAISSDERWLAIASNDNEIALVDMNSKKPTLTKVNHHTGSAVGLVFLPETSGYITVGIDRKVIQSDFKSTKLVTTIDPTPTDLAISPDGNIIVVGSRRGDVLLINRVDHPENIHSIFHDDLDSESVEAVAFSIDGKYLAFGGSSNETGKGYIHIWDRENKVEFGSKLTGFESGITDITFSSDGKYITASSRDNTVRIWSMTEKGIYSLPIVLTDHTDWVWNANFDKDNKRIFTASADGYIRVFDLEISNLKKQLCELASRPLSPQEWRAYIGNPEEYPMEQPCDR